MPRVPLKKLIIQSARHISIYAQSSCHTVYHVSKYALSWRKEVFFGEKKNKFYKDANQTENFIRVKTGNSLYYRGGKHY